MTKFSVPLQVNLSAMKDSGLPTGVRCLVGKSGGKRFLLRYTSPVTGRKESIGFGKHPETDLTTLRKTAKEYRQQILEGIDPKLERDNQTTEKTMTLARFFDEVYLPLAKQKLSPRLPCALSAYFGDSGHRNGCLGNPGNGGWIAPEYALRLWLLVGFYFVNIVLGF